MGMTTCPFTGRPSVVRAGLNWNWNIWSRNSRRYPASSMGGSTSTLVTQPRSSTQKCTSNCFPRTDSGRSAGTMMNRGSGGKAAPPPPPAPAPVPAPTPAPCPLPIPPPVPLPTPRPAPRSPTSTTGRVMVVRLRLGVSGETVSMSGCGRASWTVGTSSCCGAWGAARPRGRTAARTVRPCGCHPHHHPRRPGQRDCGTPDARSRHRGPARARGRHAPEPRPPLRSRSAPAFAAAAPRAPAVRGSCPSIHHGRDGRSVTQPPRPVRALWTTNVVASRCSRAPAA
jgi:hypothetical protein